MTDVAEGYPEEGGRDVQSASRDSVSEGDSLAGSLKGKVDIEEGSEQELRSDSGDAAEVANLRRELLDGNDRHLRLAAEFDNYRRRVQAQLGDSAARAQAEVVGRIVEVLDDLRRVTMLDPASASVESVMEGVTLLERKLLQALTDAGLDELDPAGEPFDPNTMEALARAPAKSEAEDDTVAQVLQPGFRFRGHLVRPARVTVRKYD
ncbi:MAG: nucleotide exchange factor GrpE [Gemmatimonadetes bacterium]|nr:nucleotide exchange factor GrpE [Gemmatimonadota bacterium]